MSFENPFVLWLAGLAPVFVAALYVYDRERRKQLTRRLGDLPVLAKVTASASPGRRVGKLVLVAVAFALIGVSLARPQVEGKRRVEVRGLDLVVAVDVSKSMLVDDVDQTAAMAAKHVAPSRLGRARELAAALIDELPDDRIGPVVFAGAASHVPLTEDHEVAVRFLYDLGAADLVPGSNLSEVFRVSRCMLRPDLYDDLGCASIGRRGHGGDPLPGESLDPKGTDKDDVLDQKVERGKAIVIFTDGADPDPSTPAMHIEVDRSNQNKAHVDDHPAYPIWAIAGAVVFALIGLGFAIRRKWAVVAIAALLGAGVVFAGYWVVDRARDTRAHVTSDPKEGIVDLGSARVDPDVMREVAKARELGIAVFVVGVGSTAGGVVHEIDLEGKATSTAKKNPDGSTVISKRDDAGMTAIAAYAGDDKRYFVASERGEVDPLPIAEALRGVNRGLATKKITEQRDVYQPFLFAGLMLLVIEAAISTRRRRRFPEEH